MTRAQLLQRLSEIEDAIGVLDFVSIRRMIMDTEDYILQSQRESVKAANLDPPQVAGRRINRPPKRHYASPASTRTIRLPGERHIV